VCGVVAYQSIKPYTRCPNQITMSENNELSLSPSPSLSLSILVMEWWAFHWFWFHYYYFDVNWGRGIFLRRSSLGEQTRQCSSSNRERQGNNIRELCKEKKGRWYGLPGTRKEKMTLVIRLSSLPLQLQTCYRGLFKLKRGARPWDGAP